MFATMDSDSVKTIAQQQAFTTALAGEMATSAFLLQEAVNVQMVDTAPVTTDIEMTFPANYQKVRRTWYGLCVGGDWVSYVWYNFSTGLSKVEKGVLLVTQVKTTLK